jgi:hypothetical protein
VPRKHQDTTRPTSHKESTEQRNNDLTGDDSDRLRDSREEGDDAAGSRAPSDQSIVILAIPITVDPDTKSSFEDVFHYLLKLETSL